MECSGGISANTLHNGTVFIYKANDTHEEITEELERRMADGKDACYKTIRIIAKHRHEFDVLFFMKKAMMT